MGFANGIADGMLESRASNAESDARRAAAELDSERDRFAREMRAARQEIANLRAQIAQQQQKEYEATATSLCAQSFALAFGVAQTKAQSEGNKELLEQLEKVRPRIALEAKKLMQSNDSRNSGNPHWISLVERCKTMQMNEFFKAV